MSASSFDFIVIGAGIVGLATAHELRSRFPAASIAVLEKERNPGIHASGRNSGVLHSGIYYASETLKAKVCADGATKMRLFAEEHGIMYQRSGKVIIATSEQDVATLQQLLKNAQDNHISFELLDEQGVRAIEPHAKAHRMGIYSPDTGVIDSKAVVGKLCEILKSKNVQLFFESEMLRPIPREKTIQTRAGRLSYGYLFNCAGAHADTIAKKFGLAEQYALIPFKGLYYKLTPEKSILVNSNIYPVPDIALPFLGVHFTRAISGEAYVGPTAIPALGRENYGILKGIHFGEGLQILQQLISLYAGNNNNFRHLVQIEIKKYFKSSFMGAARKLVPEVSENDLLPSSKVGIRPQLVNLREQKLEMDFIIEQTEDTLHVLNAISPAFTSAFAFAEMLIDRSCKGG
ncbi:MAG: L-2-hydroxyglutarate oxidase [Gallionella sp.]|nr:L-2-hydroxyglutarate oxidase [Gallionella sp.]